MTYRAIYSYAWDIAERGVPAYVEEVRGLGFNTVTLAGAYHAGKFVRPTGQGKVVIPEDGTVYFNADPALYGRVKPVANSANARADNFRQLTDARVPVNAWLVLMHNSRLGEAYPDLTTENAFGDRYVYSLCASAPDAREYAVALCRDVTENYPVLGVSVESPGFAPYAHGYHHEFSLMKHNRWFDNQLGLCFCRHCRDGAKAAGIDADRLAAQVREDVESWLKTDFDLPDDMAEAFWVADTRADGDLARFLSWRNSVTTSLVAEIRAAVRKDATVAVIPSVARPTAGAWYEGSDLPALAKAAGIIEACFYEPSAERVRVDAWDVKRRLRGEGAVRGILRAGYPDLKNAGEVAAAVRGLAEAGIDDIAFYCFGHYRQASLDWIRDAFAALDR